VFEWTDDGKPLKMYGTHQEITQRKQYEEQLRISEEAFRGNFENAAIGMAMLDENGHWLNVNDRVCETLGYSAEELQLLTFQDLTHPDDLNSDLELLKELVERKRDYYHMEKRYIHKDGHIVHAILGVSVVRNSNGEILYFISQIIDITDLKLAENNLSSALAQNQATMDASTQVAIIRTDLDGVIKEFNVGAEIMLGYREDELIGTHTPEVIHLAEEIRTEKQTILEETGEVVEGFDVFVYRAKDGLPYTREWTYQRRNGSTFPVLLSVTAIKQDDEITGYLGVATNISELKKAQKEINTILCITENQNERLQNFSHIVSHNLRSHAGGIIGMLEVLRLEHPEIYENQFVQLLNKGADNLQNTIESLTELVKNDFTEDGELKRVSLTPYIERNKNSVVTLAMKRGVNVINNVPEDIEVFVIPGYLDSIAMNFITNAIKYSDPEKDSYVKISAKEQGDFVQLSFKDNGLGIDMERDGNDLFGMYNTFHEHEDSRGVGLYITKSQIESMGGSVEVESALGVGTTFRVSLPKPEGENLPKNSVKRTAQRSLSSKKNGLHPA
jgi:PAS domain S-box-containing protein